MSNVTFKAIAGIGSVICLLIGMTLVLKLDSSDAKQATTLTPTQSSIAAMSNVETAESAVQEYFAAHGSYAGMNVAALQTSGGGALPVGFAVGWADTTQYCIEDTTTGGTAYVVGPSGTPAPGSCPAA